MINKCSDTRVLGTLAVQYHNIYLVFHFLYLTDLKSQTKQSSGGMHTLLDFLQVLDRKKLHKKTKLALLSCPHFVFSSAL